MWAGRPAHFLRAWRHHPILSQPSRLSSPPLQREPPQSPVEPDAEPLSAVLSGRTAGAGGQQQELSFINAGLDTTDL